MEEEGRPTSELQWLEHIAGRLDHLEGEVAGLTKWSEQVDERLNRIDERFDQLEMKFNQRIDDLEERMDRRFDDVHGAIKNLDARVFRIERGRSLTAEAAE